ncbi:hypothetical protein [Flavobacterium lindanitolerans]|uniref:hypothetical protein n=1 Tax=Flavobacterium lindanitolerans TaxID=428988 RepID=UPI001219D2EB|nr:hypothetical protein [Flavobacterium lindanitolerans]MDQ7961638.1 hypothetical protein [Flavobacterium lindanitolerans]THD31483.1 MAG: hypothetical protein DI588_12040 [Flavobacterium johnsoniae]
MIKNINCLALCCIFIILLSFNSCDSESDTITIKDTVNNITIGYKTIAPKNIIEVGDNGDVKFLIKKSILLSNWNHNLKLLEKIDANLTDIRVFREYDNYYIQAVGKEWTSTILLRINEKVGIGEGISCTSNICSNSSTECVPKPDKKSCTGCGFKVGDCTKTVTAIALMDEEFTLQKP